MIFAIIATLVIVLTVIDAILDYNCVEINIKENDIVGWFWGIGIVLSFIFVAITVFSTGRYHKEFALLCKRQELVSEQYLMSKETAEDWEWICKEMNNINEEMKALSAEREARKLVDLSAFTSYSYETHASEIGENTISFAEERHLIPLRRTE